MHLNKLPRVCVCTCACVHVCVCTCVCARVCVWGVVWGLEKPFQLIDGEAKCLKDFALL